MMLALDIALMAANALFMLKKRSIFNAFATGMLFSVIIGKLSGALQ